LTGLDALGSLAARALPPGPCLVVTDRIVGRLYGARAARSLRRAGFDPVTVALPPGERSKTLETAGRLCGVLAEMGADRGTVVVALGGGVVTDLAGFVAAIYVRGLPWIAVPTTLLAMADAAVGGKTGVDLPRGKNLVGAFHAARLVVDDPGLLRTLPRRHVRNGLAEIAKMELLRGLRAGLPRVRRLAAAARGPASLGRAARRAAASKAALVARDPFERRGVRVLLNLGHTVGHALEAATGYDGSVLHGEAVAVGLVAAARVAEARGIVRRGEAAALADALESLDLPVALPGKITGWDVLRHAAVDKKREGGTLRMVLPRTAGSAVVATVDVPELAAALG
jgi:3-dehydroquinate synthase